MMDITHAFGRELVHSPRAALCHNEPHHQIVEKSQIVIDPSYAVARPLDHICFMGCLLVWYIPKLFLFDVPLDKPVESHLVVAEGATELPQLVLAEVSKKRNNWVLVSYRNRITAGKSFATSSRHSSMALLVLIGGLGGRGVCKRG